MPILGVLEGRVYRGHEDVRRWVEDLVPDWEVFEVSHEQLRDLGDRVLIFGYRAEALAAVGLPEESRVPSG